MFTVKHRAPDGTETLYSAETVTVIGGPDCSPIVTGDSPALSQPARNMYEEGIYLDREELPSAPDEPPISSANHIIPFGGDETAARKARKGGKVWVMDSSGSTVASYNL
jgi:hypothetical protein